MLTITPRTFINEKLDTVAKRRTAASKTARERQGIIENLLVRYPSFRDAEEFLKRFHRPVDGGCHGRGQIGGLLGISNAGKSFVLESYVGEVGADETVPGAVIRRALYVNLTNGCTPKDLASGVFRALGFDVVPRHSTTQLMDHTARMVTNPEARVELVVIDDAQYLLCASNPQTVKQSLGFILGMAKSKTCNVLLGGTTDVAGAVRSFAHAYNQGLFPNYTLRPYRWEVTEERGAFLVLLDSVDARLPFEKPSGLADPYIAANLYRASNGALGSVMQIVKAAAFDAINKEQSHITLANLELAARDRSNPSDPHKLFTDPLDFEMPMLTEVQAESNFLQVSLSRKRKA